MSKAKSKAATDAAETNESNLPQPKEGQRESTSPVYERWNCKITRTKEGPQFKKLERTAARILISDAQAELLNEGLLNGENAYAELYFPAE